LVCAEYELDGTQDYDCYVGEITLALNGRKWLWKGMACEHMADGTWKPMSMTPNGAYLLGQFCLTDNTLWCIVMGKTPLLLERRERYSGRILIRRTYS